MTSKVSSAVSAYLCDLCVKWHFNIEIAEIRRDRREKLTGLDFLSGQVLTYHLEDLIGIIV